VSPQDTLVAPIRDRSPLLGRYRLLERLGAGGFGVVWRAHDELLHREVAVKQISLPPGSDRERAIREALAVARLSHPAIVALYEACEEDDAFYLISELVHGATLARLIANGELSDEEILAIGVAVAAALEHAHARGVIHRDVKPQNVLIPQRPAQQAGAAKLTDFGGALLTGEDALTRTGDVLGTLAYMAPEQSEGREVDEAADLYSLALVLYESFSGVNPVRGPNPAATARRIGRELPPLERYRGDLPRSLTRSLDAALSPEPEDRGSLGQLRGALKDDLEHPAERSRRWRRNAATTALPPIRHSQAAPRGPAQPEHTAEFEHPVPHRWLTPPRLAWLAGALALCAWELEVGRPAMALLAVCAVLPVIVLVRRPGPQWLAAGLAPALGLAGLAGAFPAAAGQAARWPSRALLGALGYWWLRLAEPLLQSPSNAVATHTLGSLPSLGLLLGLALWGLAAALLPWVVRGHNALLDTTTAVIWAVALAATALLAVPLLHHGLSIPLATQHDVILGAALGAAFAVLARALRGPS
jgi:eukaryotic-like serine/threonine-protein kinase